MMSKKMLNIPFVPLVVVFVMFGENLIFTTAYNRPTLSKRNIFDSLEGFKLTGHMIETLVTDEFDCGLRCLRKRKCRSYNSQSDGNHGNITCELSDQTKETKPDDMRRSPGFIYFGKEEKGRSSSHPSHSCKDILNSGDARGDGEYWIDPEKNGNPLKVYCDMTTNGGGWILIFNIRIDDQYNLPTLSLETSYRRIDSYGSNNLVLANSAINELRKHLSFTQLRFHCSKQQGRTFHVTTVANSTGEAVIQYYTGQTETKPDSCGSFVTVKGDNSYLAAQCAEWGFENNYRVGKWGHDGMRELYNHPAFVSHAYHWVIYGPGNRWECDDYAVPPSAGDFWKIFVR